LPKGQDIALLNAVGKTIPDVGYRLSKTSEAERPGKVIFVITIDGLKKMPAGNSPMKK